MVTNIARPSVASLLLQAEVNGTALGTATGFVVTKDAVSYLVTNRHVVRGRHQDTQVPFHPSASTPDSIRITHNATQLGTWLAKVEGLYDSSDRPLWYEHPVHGGYVDVVALPLTDLRGISLFAYDPWAPLQVAIQTAEPLSIIGFPFGMTGGGSLALWVRGFVASEIAVDFNGLPCFLIDSRTRPGQSGSPVIFYDTSGSYRSTSGGTVLAGGLTEEFVGVYSGRINVESDLGLVWRSDVVKDIIVGAMRPSAA